MERKVEQIEVITYTVSRQEIIDAVLRYVKTEDGNTLLCEGFEVNGVPDEIEFVYQYSNKNEE